MKENEKGRLIKLICFLLLGIFLLAVTVDVVVSYIRIPQMEFVFDAPQQVDVGDNTTVAIGVRVLEKNLPRSGDMIQCWILQGDGRLQPEYFFLDNDGRAEVLFKPNQLTQYSEKTAVLAFADINTGTIIELNKTALVEISLQEKSFEKKSIFDF